LNCREAEDDDGEKKLDVAGESLDSTTAVGYGDDSITAERYLRSVPMRRLAQPEEIAAAIAFPASEKAAFITGQTIFVDGGASLGTL
jgi:NAD(P)-dependent dehydrogenase (short-subunit alcohol dehydrogenase family)